MKPAPKRGALPTGLWLLRNSLHPVVVLPREKRPAESGWATARPGREHLIETFGRHPGAGVGLALGPEPGVVDFETDGPGFELDLPPSLGWRSPRGSHVVFRWDKRLEGLPAVVHLGGGAAELRVGGEGKQVMSVCPPTVGDDRRRRAWSGVWDIAPLPEALLRAVEKPVQASRPPLDPTVPGGTSRYADAALRSEARAVAAAAEGTRNTTLNRAAFKLGTLIGAGWLVREGVEDVLLEAARECGLPEREARATINSGLEAGIKRPRTG